MKYPTIRLIFDRKKTATKEKSSLVQIEVMYQRQRKYFSTGVKLYSEQWNEKKMVVARVDCEDLNTILTNMVSKIRKYIMSLQERNEAFSFSSLELYLENEEGNTGSFLEFMYDRIQLRELEDSTRNQHMVVYRKLLDFGKMKTFNDITVPVIKSFDDYIRQESTKCQSTIYSIHKRVKPYVREALELGYIKKDPYDVFKTQAGHSQTRKYLTSAEMDRIEKCKLAGPVSNVRDMFVFCCYTGMAYSDLAKFDFAEDVVESGSKYFIQDQRQKTKAEFYTVILPKAMEILKKWNYKLPIVSLQRYNIDLKQIQFRAGIKKGLTSHMARHTFATTVTLANDVPIEIVSRMLGHTNIKTTQIYAKVLNSSIEKHMNELDKKLKKGLK